MIIYISRPIFLAPTGELYELLCHRKKERKKERKGIEEGEDPHKMNVFGITRILFIWFGLDLGWTHYLGLETSLRKNFSFFSKSKIAAGGQRSEIAQIWPHKSHAGSAFRSSLSDLDNIWHGHTTWHDPTRNKPADFFIFSKTKMAAGGQKLNFGSKSHFGLANGSLSPDFEKKLAGRYYSTIGTSFRKNFLPIAKSKMAAAAAITANYEIGHNLKSIQVRDQFFS